MPQKSSKPEQSAFELGTKTEAIAPPVQREPLFEDQPETVRTLIRRIKDGHNKLWERWALIKTMPENSTKDNHTRRWDEGKVRLMALCDELTEQGYNKCMYHVKPEHQCLVCPMKPWVQEKCLCHDLDIIDDARR